jgi:hypothetical protein
MDFIHCDIFIVVLGNKRIESFVLVRIKWLRKQLLGFMKQYMLIFIVSFLFKLFGCRMLEPMNLHTSLLGSSGKLNIVEFF